MAKHVIILCSYYIIYISTEGMAGMASNKCIEVKELIAKAKNCNAIGKEENRGKNQNEFRRAPSTCPQLS